MRRRHSFTLIELLVVMAILSILAGLFSVGLSQARTMARKLKARESIGQIGTALQAYHAEYSAWPTRQDNSVPTALLTSAELAALYQMLEGQDRTLDATGTGIGNPKLIPFLSGKSTQMKPVTPAGSLYRAGGSAITNWVDPWNTSYMILLDADEDGQVLTYGDAVNNPFIKAGFAIWSAGPDMQVDLTEPSLKDSIPVNKDNVSSWKQ